MELSLREIQLAELDILKIFSEFCKKEELKYSLVGGTLLGAVRHQGFIPWDDDIDVGMPRPDYEKFIELFMQKRDQFPANIDLTTDRGEKAMYPFIKLLNTDIQIQSNEGDLTNYVWIDIFPLDGYPSSERATQKFQKKVKNYRRLFSYNYKNYNSLNGILRKLFYRAAKCYGAKKALNKLIALSNKYTYSESDYIGIVAWGLYWLGERMPKDEFEQFVEMSFEENKFTVMGCWDNYLHGIYGDYMQLPPEDKRATHSFKAYTVEKDS